MQKRWRTLFPITIKKPALISYERWLRKHERYTPAVKEAFENARRISAKFKFIFYIAGPLTNASEDDKKRYEITSIVLRKYGVFGYVPHLHGTDPIQHPRVTPEEVRDIDFLWAVVVADFHINFLHPIGHGNAIEEGWVETFGIPTMYCYPTNTKLSRLPRGMLNVVLNLLYNNGQNLNVKLEIFASQLKELCGEKISTSSKKNLIEALSLVLAS